jgi:choline transporter-like protein 2/4/5
MLLVYPLVTISGLIVLMVWWLVVAAYIVSTDGLTLQSISDAAGYESPLLNSTAGYESPLLNSTATNVTATAVVNNNSTASPGMKCGDTCMNMPIMRYVMLYHFFGLLWTNQVLQGIAIMVISGAVSKWYFAGPHDVPDEDLEEDELKDRQARLDKPLMKSCCRTLRYHVGTVMFGGFIIAAVQFMRAILEYVDSQTKSWQDKNKLLACAFKMLRCCLYCFEKCVKYVSQMAYITTAISGSSFCVSAYRSIQLFQRESALINIVYMISQFILTLSKILICMSSGGITYLWLTYGFDGDDKVSNVAFPTMLSMIFGYFVAEGVLDVYTTGIDTILICYGLDKEHNEGTANVKAGESLRTFIKVNKSKKKTAAGEEEDDDDDDANAGSSDAKFTSVAPAGGDKVVSI